MSTAAQAAFRLRDVTVRFADVVALVSISLTIAPGERVGFVGPSGAGKTTLLRLLNANQQATSGEVFLLGEALEQLDQKGLREVRSAIGFVPQHYHLVPSLRVLQNVLLGRLGQQGFWASLRSVFCSRETEQVAVHALLERVGISEKLFAKVDTLSGGQQQRVAIARALYQAPKALLADEPVASVDPTRAEATMALLTTLAEEQNLTLGVSLHDQRLARAFLPRLIGVRGGKIFKDAPATAWTDSDFEELYHLEKRDLVES